MKFDNYVIRILEINISKNNFHTIDLRYQYKGYSSAIQMGTERELNPTISK